MNEKASAAASGGPGCATLLTLLFISLKLTDHIDWSWWWVLAPAWIPAAAVVIIFVITLCWAVRQ